MTVWPMEEGGVVVKTDDVEEARAAYARWLAQEGDLFGTTADEAASRARARTGWYRWAPCSPRSCYDHGGHRPGHLHPAREGARGAWQGVEVNR